MSAPAEQDAEQPYAWAVERDGKPWDLMGQGCANPRFEAEKEAAFWDGRLVEGAQQKYHTARAFPLYRRSAPAPSTAGKTNAAPEGAALSGESTEASPEHAGPLGQQDGASEGTTGFTPLNAPSRNRAAPTLARKEGDRNVIATTDPGECSRCGNHICRGVKVFPICEHCAPAPSTAATEALNALARLETMAANGVQVGSRFVNAQRHAATVRAALSAGSASTLAALELNEENYNALGSVLERWGLVAIPKDEAPGFREYSKAKYASNNDIDPPGSAGSASPAPDGPVVVWLVLYRRARGDHGWSFESFRSRQDAEAYMRAADNPNDWEQHVVPVAAPVAAAQERETK